MYKKNIIQNDDSDLKNHNDLTLNPHKIPTLNFHHSSEILENLFEERTLQFD